MKLTIELVPQTCWCSNVRSGVNKRDWDVLRKKVYAEAGHRCEICGGVGRRHPVECHEVWNYNDETKVQKLESMIALCSSCHTVKHFGRAQVRGVDAQALRHLCKVNRLSVEEGKRYIREAFLVWETRSGFEWGLDLSGLDRYGVEVSLKKSVEGILEYATKGGR